MEKNQIILYHDICPSIRVWKLTFSSNSDTAFANPRKDVAIVVHGIFLKSICGASKDTWRALSNSSILYCL